MWSVACQKATVHHHHPVHHTVVAARNAGRSPPVDQSTVKLLQADTQQTQQYYVVS